MRSLTRQCADILFQLPLFRELAQGEVLQLASMARLVHLESRQVIYARGDVCDGFYVVVYGRVKLSLISPRGTEKPLEIIEPGGCFGEVTMFLERTHLLTAVTLDDSLLTYVPRSALTRMIESDSRFALRLLASLSMRVGHAVDDIEAFSLQPPAARLVTYLLRLLPPDAPTPARIELTIRKNLVAAQLNLAPETLSRYFRELKERGLISLEGREVLVHDIERLSEFLSQLN